MVFNDPEILKIFHNLDHYGVNLSQIARHLNQGGSMTNQMQKNIRDCISEIYKNRNAIR